MEASPPTAPALSMVLKHIPVDQALRILKWSEQLNFSRMIHKKMMDLPSYWSRFSWYSSTSFKPNKDDYTKENFEHLYVMTYHMKLNDEARWLWRNFASNHGVIINPYKMEHHELARKYRRMMARRIRPTFIEARPVMK